MCAHSTAFLDGKKVTEPLLVRDASRKVVAHPHIETTVIVYASDYSVIAGPKGHREFYGEGDLRDLVAAAGSDPYHNSDPLPWVSLLQPCTMISGRYVHELRDAETLLVPRVDRLSSAPEAQTFRKTGDVSLREAFDLRAEVLPIVRASTTGWFLADGSGNLLVALPFQFLGEEAMGEIVEVLNGSDEIYLTRQLPFDEEIGEWEEYMVSITAAEGKSAKETLNAFTGVVRRAGISHAEPGSPAFAAFGGERIPTGRPVAAHQDE